ncbi:MAG TPA: hypothetical protein EYN57_06485 [Candidatus Lambdaproteobacteria bacterium]|nr:hypothetical protein [Candidatus Lambdaproteobacteria bacterium]
MNEKLPPQIKQKRSEILRILSTKKRHLFHQRFLGQTRKVLWESRKQDGFFSGYTDNYIRVVLDENDETDYRNQLFPVELNSLRGQTMLGKIKI